ncbi:MAG: hypothetical protein H6Q42_4501, partial [Deltaproteobacteria bacterium]|nr:hypothetical protein [Deltaproteobacteria bacterium]
GSILHRRNFSNLTFNRASHLLKLGVFRNDDAAFNTLVCFRLFKSTLGTGHHPHFVSSPFRLGAIRSRLRLRHWNGLRFRSFLRSILPGHFRGRSLLLHFDLPPNLIKGFHKPFRFIFGTLWSKLSAFSGVSLNLFWRPLSKRSSSSGPITERPKKMTLWEATSSPPS